MDGQGLSKIILIGEHSVVYGHMAIAIPFHALKSVASLTPSKTFILTTKYYDGPLENANDVMKGLKVLIDTLIDNYNIITPLHIKVMSNLPEKSGLGSSASVARAIINAFDNYFNLHLTNEDYFSYLQVSENIYHAKASGIDASTLILEKAITYENGVAHPFSLNIDGHLMVVHSKTNSATRDAVQMVSENVHKDIFINELAKLTKDCKEALLNNDFLTLATSFNAAHSTLRSLGLSTPTLEQLRTKLIDSGASAVKITGGGMGGCLIALFETRDKALISQKQLQDYSSWIINLREVI